MKLSQNKLLKLIFEPEVLNDKLLNELNIANGEIKKLESKLEDLRVAYNKLGTRMIHACNERDEALKRLENRRRCKREQRTK